MIKPSFFYKSLKDRGVNFFTGVPDSLLKYFCAYVFEKTPEENHVIAANEGNAVALNAGNYLATGDIGLVYMQNSGLGNAVNPLLSLMDQSVYSIPLLLLIGWRGQPGTKDAAQHIKQGEATLKLLESMDIPYEVLSESEEEVEEIIDKAFSFMKSEQAPFALVVPRGLFTEYQLSKQEDEYEMAREEAIGIVLSHLKEDDIVISSTGKTSREIYEIREEKEGSHEKDFLMVGSMGHCSQIALGVALKKNMRNVFCFDGDGSFLMHMGGQAIIGSRSLENFKHIVLNNEAHDSVGGQPTVGDKIDFGEIAFGCGYNHILQAESREELKAAVDKFCRMKGPALLEIRVKKGARSDLGRPDIGPKKRRDMFMEFLQDR